jgi:hypothetical protein
MLEGLARPQSKAVYCKVQMQIAELEPADREILIQALADARAWPASTLSTQLRLRGVSLADVTITKHRTQACACYRD